MSGLTVFFTDIIKTAYFAYVPKPQMCKEIQCFNPWVPAFMLSYGLLGFFVGGFLEAVAYFRSYIARKPID